ncbi:MAG: 50S ribosomal protein L10 [Bacteroidales bacterium]|nr:50S ribosomal protein L10 [Bacteroidales bacterium]
MRREEKNAIISELEEKLKKYNHFYLADISELNASDTSLLRRRCFEKEIQLVVVKNTMLRKALEKFDGTFDELYGSLKQSTSVMFCDTGNTPAKLIRDFRKGHEKPILKAAYVEESIYVGDNMLETLSTIKSKEELIGDVIILLQSPMNNLLSALKSGGNQLAGALQVLAEKEE